MRFPVFPRVLIFTVLLNVVLGTLESDIKSQMSNGTSRSLSRRRRYLTFPEGSSLQLVFCLTYPTLGMGQIFVIGATAALAWELPHDPFAPYRKEADALHRIDTKISPNSYKLKTKSKISPIVLHPKRPSSTNFNGYNPNRFSYNRWPQWLYSTLKNIQQTPAITYPKRKRPQYNALAAFGGKDEFRGSKVPITTYVDPVYHQVHRRTRRELFGKIEKLFKAQNQDGRACLLKAICEVHQAPKEKGSFMQEIMKTIFKPKPHEEYADEDDYDTAANKDHNCSERYPSCKSSIWNV